MLQHSGEIREHAMSCSLSINWEGHGREGERDMSSTRCEPSETPPPVAAVVAVAAAAAAAAAVAVA
eukprot:scaffold24914_cov70-Phaeocystis_antarctica.AAC.4